MFVIHEPIFVHAHSLPLLAQSSLFDIIEFHVDVFVILSLSMTFIKHLNQLKNKLIMKF